MGVNARSALASPPAGRRRLSSTVRADVIDTTDAFVTLALSTREGLIDIIGKPLGQA